MRAHFLWPLISQTSLRDAPIRLCLRLCCGAVLAGLLSACGGGGGNGGVSSSAAPTNIPANIPAPPDAPDTPVAPSGRIIISGQISFARVPHSASNFGLDYGSEFAAPARSIHVQAINAAGEVTAQALTDETGQYHLEAAQNTDISIRAVAQMSSDGAAQWDVNVTDNTQNEAGYALQGERLSTGIDNSVRNLHAPSGWDGTHYSQMRSAAPFAILDSVYEAIETLEGVDPDIQIPALNIGWSPENNTARGAIADGDIGSSQYDPFTDRIYILGREGNDTDEYDPHVIAHEFGHFFEDTLSRSDSIGGAHNAADFLDPRVALGEGFGNALAAIVLDDPIYRDALNLNQASGFTIDIESNSPAIVGWYSEASVHSVLYDIYDSAPDGIDRIAAGFAPIYEALTSRDYREAPSFTTMFSLSDELRNSLNLAQSEQMDLLLLAQGMIGTGKTGIGESNTGGLAQSLPLYKPLSAGSSEQNLCSYAQRGTGNQLGNYAFASLSVAQTGSYRLSAVQNDGGSDADPDMRIYRVGEEIETADSLVIGREDWSGTLEAGEYSVALYEYENSLPQSAGRTACFSLNFDRNP